MRHEIDKDKSIFEFIKGNHPVVWFSAGGAAVICSHVFRKKGRKTPKSEIDRAIRLRDKYFDALATGTLSYWSAE